MNDKHEETSLEIRRNKRLENSPEPETELITILKELWSTLQSDIEEDDFIQILDRLLDNINQMKDEEIDMFSSYISYTDILDLIINTENLELQTKLFKFVCLMMKGDEFDPYEFIQPEYLLFLILITKKKELSSFSFYILSELCNECHQLPLILLEYNVLDGIEPTAIDEIQSQLLFIFIRDIKQPELLIRFIPFVTEMIQSQNVDIVYNGIQSFSILNLYSKDPSFPEDYQTSVGELSAFFLSNFSHIFELNDIKSFSQYLLILSTIDNLPANLIPLLMELFENESPKLLRSVADIFITQVGHWKELIDPNDIYQKLIPKLECEFPFDIRLLIFQTLVLYGNVEFYMNPIILSNIHHFMECDSTRLCCFQAIYQILISEQNVEGIFDDYIDDIMESVTNELENGISQETIHLANEILSLLNSA